MQQESPKIALVHDHLTQDGGAERVLRVLSDMYPDAPIYTLVHDQKRFHALKEKDIRTSFIQRLPLGKRKFEWFLPLMPTATEHYDLSEFDVIVSSTSAMAKGVIPAAHAKHICYCHTPTRYLWTDTHEYIRNLKIPGLIKALLPAYLSMLRVWDRMAAERVDHFVANSKTVEKRIGTYYNKSASVVYPPVDTHLFSVAEGPKTYFLAGGRIAAYKRFDLLVEVFNRLRLPLMIFGDGPFLDELKARAKDNITFLGRVSDTEKAELYRNAIAYFSPQVEDFGITTVEAMASGRPVIAFGQGGSTETVIPGITGELFHEQSWESLADTVIRFDHTRYNPETIRTHAEQFSVEAFKRKMRGVIDEVSGQPTGQLSFIEETLS